MASYRTMGFQATNLALAIDEVNKMVRRQCVVIENIVEGEGDCV